MSIWLDPTGKSTFGIGLCDRCSRKMSLDDLYPDPNFPGLRVCKNDLDDLDPWRLAARQTEDIHLPFTRPDRPLTDGLTPYVYPPITGGAYEADTPTKPVDANGNIVPIR